MYSRRRDATGRVWIKGHGVRESHLRVIPDVCQLETDDTNPGEGYCRRIV